MARTTSRSCILALTLAACTVNSDTDPFGSGTATTYPTTVSTTVPSSDDGTSSESTDGGEEDTGDADTDGGAESSTGIDPTAADGTTDGGIDPTAATTDDGGMNPDGNQPADGLWSQCTTAQECGAIPSLCIYVVDANMNPTDGFCSETGCANPAVDCPSPGGTATPVCVPIEVNGQPEQACALNCAAGMCPVGMNCMNITDLGMICI